MLAHYPWQLKRNAPGKYKKKKILNTLNVNTYFPLLLQRVTLHKSGNNSA
jgi:hypothetical protein